MDAGHVTDLGHLPVAGEGSLYLQVDVSLPALHLLQVSGDFFDQLPWNDTTSAPASALLSQPTQVQAGGGHAGGDGVPVLVDLVEVRAPVPRLRAHRHLEAGRHSLYLQSPGVNISHTF